MFPLGAMTNKAAMNIYVPLSKYTLYVHDRPLLKAARRICVVTQ